MGQLRTTNQNHRRAIRRAVAAKLAAIITTLSGKAKS